MALVQIAVVAWAGLLVEIEPPVFAAQMSRHAWLIGQQSGAWHLSSCGRKRRFGPRDIGAEVLKAELQLVVFERFGTPAKLAALPPHRLAGRQLSRYSAADYQAMEQAASPKQPDEPGCDRRTFEFPRCQHLIVKIIQYREASAV